MPGKYQYDIELKSNVAKLLTDMKEVQDRLDTVEGKEYKIKLNVDEKKLSNVISNLEKMLDSLGKGTGDFKQFENLSKYLNNLSGELSSIKTMNDTFIKMETSIASIKKVFADVGDGEEFSPLLKTLNDIKEAASNIKLNFNMDLGDEVSERLNQKISQASARQLEAYRKLFSAMKGTGKTNKEMFQFFEPDDASVTELIGIYKGIIERAEKQFKVGNSNIYKKYLGAEYDTLKREITNANKQLSRADSKRSENGILGDLFGNTKDLSGIIEQLSKIIKKLDDISKSALEFKSTFKEGFNITASVEEIDKLTNRVKELEDELSKIKLNPVNVDKSNISSGTQIEDVFQGDKIDQATTSAKELDKTLEQVDIPTDSFNDVLSKLDLTESKLKEIVKITKQSVSDSEGKFHDSYTLKDKRGSTEIYGLSSNTEKGQLLRSNIVGYDAKSELQESKRLVEENIRLNKTYYDSKKQDEDEYQKLRAKYLAEGKSQEEKYYADLQKYADSEVEYYKNREEKYQRLREEYKIEGKSQEDFIINQAWEEANKVNNALNETKNILSSLPRMTELDTQFSSLDAKLSSLNGELTSGKISVADYKKEVKSLTSEYSKLVTIQQNRDVETYRQNSKSAEQEAKAIQEEWDKNVKAIQDYMDAVTKLNNLNAKDKGTGKYASQIALQEKNVEELKEKALEARTAISSMINPHDVPLNTWRDYLDVMKKFDQASLGSAESVAKLEDALRKMDFSSLESAGTKFKSQFKNLSIKPDGDHQFLSWTNDLKELNAKIDEYNSKVKYLKENNIVDGEQVVEVKNLRDEIEKTINAMSKTPQTKRGWTDIGASKAAEKVANVLKQNTKMSKEARDAIKAYYDELRSGNPSQPIDEILVKVNQLVQKERELGRVGKSFGEIFKEKVIYGGAAQLAGMVGFYDVINVGREIVTNIKEVDTALTELRKVSDATEQRLTTNFKNSADTAKELGATISDVISATADWSRMGYNINQAEELARVSTLYKNVGDGIDIETANNSLISTLQGFQLDASEAESIIDKFNEVANNYAIDSAGIGEALQRSAASFNAANTDLSKSIALITATNEVVQNPDSVGTLWKTMSARIRGAETELEELGEETDEYTKTTSKLRDLIQSLTGFDIMIDEDTFKDVYEIILGIGKEWDNLTDVEQASLGEALAGKRNANALYAVLGNLDTLQAAYETAENSAGSAMREQENYEKSIQYSLDRLSASAQEWSNTLVSSDVIKWFVDLTNAAVELSTALTPLGTIAIGGGIVAFVENLDHQMVLKIA